MTRAILTLSSRAIRDKAVYWIKNVPAGTRIVFHEPKRTLPQNDAMWAALGDIAKQKHHHGLRLTDADWKLLFLDALKAEVRMVPNLDGTGLVGIGRSSSELSVAEMSGLLEVIYAWGAANGVTFRDPPSSTQGAGQPKKLAGRVAA